MKKDKLKESEDRYWKGTSSLKDELELKQNADSNYFNGLHQLSNERVDMDFEDFLTNIDLRDKKVSPKKGKERVIYNLLYYVAAVVLIISAFLFFEPFKADNQATIRPQFAEVKLIPKSSKSLSESIAVQNADRETDKLIVHAIPNRLSKKREKQIIEGEKEIAGESDAIESFVMVNGKPIQDEVEAEEIVLASLKLITTNLYEGKEAIEKVKYIHVEL
ncbi:hypothetical protein [Sphingobacterium sp. LRF_L2]|uniref:hypothetical protein n=1 Tax=Sphingobacterium sp. LRF_L2 TaxID=3369421 RepID=UPI003F5D9854